MIKRMVSERKRVEVVERAHDFHWKDDPNSGFTFPVDCRGDLLPGLADAAKANYEYCLSHPEELVDEGIVAHRRSYVENARAICEGCSKEIELWDQFQGASECPYCGQWHNLFGQSLIDPEYWEEAEGDV